jgi:hypothetical protein
MRISFDALDQWKKRMINLAEMLSNALTQAWKIEIRCEKYG